jgi:acyl carrier protein
VSNLEKYERAIRDIFELSEDADVTLSERGITDNWDSLGHLMLISEIEDTFTIEIAPEDIIKFKDYKSGIELLKKYDIEI